MILIFTHHFGADVFVLDADGNVIYHLFDHSDHVKSLTAKSVALPGKGDAQFEAIKAQIYNFTSGNVKNSIKAYLYMPAIEGKVATETPEKKVVPTPAKAKK